MRLLGDGTRFLGLWLGASREQAAALDDALAARWPLAVHAVDAAGALARHLGVGAGGFVLVRPDAYVAARLESAAPAAIESALRRALSLEAST